MTFANPVALLGLLFIPAVILLYFLKLKRRQVIVSSTYLWSRVLEDRRVKNFLVRESAQCICPPGLPVCVCGHQPRLRLVNRRIIRPEAEEVATNPRSRSARLRAAERLPA